MKAKKFLKYLKTSLYFSTGLFTLSLVSCSTTWTKWNPDVSTAQTEQTFAHTIAPESLWQVRPLSQILKAYDVASTTIDLDLVNNQFELSLLIVAILQLKAPISIDEYWIQSKWAQLIDYVDNLNPKLNLKLKHRQSQATLNYDISDNIDILKADLYNYLPPYVLAENEKVYDVEKHGLDAHGAPIDFSEVAVVGFPLTQLEMVASLLRVDSGFALKLSKLVNLPRESFAQFSDFVRKLDDFNTRLFQSNTLASWILDKGLDFMLLNTGVASVNLNDFTPTMRFKSIFIIDALKKE